MIFTSAASIVRFVSTSNTKLLLCATILHLAIALIPNAAHARPHMPTLVRRPIHFVARRPVTFAVAPGHFLGRRPLPFMARRPARSVATVARFGGRPRVISRRFVRFAQRQPALSLQSVLRAQAPAPGFEPGVIAEAMRYLGAANVTGSRGAWCADYASMVLSHTGHRPLANRMASSALAYGPRVGQPRPGDLVVLNTRRGFAQHVGFFAGWDHGRVVIVSGNWGHRVARAAIYQGAVAAFIRV